MERLAPTGPDIAAVARLLGDQTRATIVGVLVGDRAMPASELASLAGVSRPTASEHLAQLVDCGLLRVERRGRHAYYQVASTDVAAALEALAVIAPLRRPTSLRSSHRLAALSEARTCYDHLAGRLGVAMADGLVDQGLVSKFANDLEINAEAWDANPPLGVTTVSLPKTRRPILRGCVDWSERRPHLAGSLAVALTTRLFELGWIIRIRDRERAVKLTDRGKHLFFETFGLDQASAGASGVREHA